MSRIVFATCLLLLFASDSQTGVASLVETVPIGNPGNTGFVVDPNDTNDTRWYKFGTFGSVSEHYRIGTTEVTNDQYVTMLNAVASTDTHSLFDPRMASDPRGGILRTGTSGNYSYSSRPNMGNKPVNFVRFWHAMRFTNWLHNGMPSGNQDLTSTEDGAYFLGGETNPTDRNVTRKANARWFLPSDDEWFKAAYHKNDGITGNFFEYPTATDVEPIRATADAFGNISNPGSNVANYNKWADWNGQDGNVTTVGSAQSQSAYGTFDQAGNLDEWTDTLLFCDPNGCPVGPAPDEENFIINAVVRGGTWRDGNDFHIVGITNSNRDVGGTNNGNHVIGFRVATIVIPGDFDLNGEVNGEDFTMWQRGESPDPFSSMDLADWLANYGQVAPLSFTVPEPATGITLLGGMMAILLRRRGVVP